MHNKIQAKNTNVVSPLILYQLLQILNFRESQRLNISEVQKLFYLPFFVTHKHAPIGSE